MSDHIQGHIKSDHATGKFEFLMILPREKIVNKKEAWEIFGKLQKMDMNYPDILRAMADMIEAAGL